jgi:hypothetical protein
MSNAKASSRFFIVDLLSDVFRAVVETDEQTNSGRARKSRDSSEPCSRLEPIDVCRGRTTSSRRERVIAVAPVSFGTEGRAQPIACRRVEDAGDLIPEKRPE